MSKIMEIIAKENNYEAEEQTLTLMDTTFSSLGKNVTTVPGQHWNTATAGDPVGYEIFGNLLDEQKRIYTQMVDYMNSYNSYIQNNIWNQYGRAGSQSYPLYQMSHQPSYVVSNGEAADFSLLNKVVNTNQAALYGNYHDIRYKFSENIKNNLIEWSKGRDYTETVKDISVGLISKGAENFYVWRYSGPLQYTITHENNSETCVFTVHNLNSVFANAAIGTSYTIEVEAEWYSWGSGDDADEGWTWQGSFFITFTKHSLGVAPDTGRIGVSYYTYRTMAVSTAPYVRSRTGASSGHFATTGEVSPTWITTRNIRV